MKYLESYQSHTNEIKEFYSLVDKDKYIVDLAILKDILIEISDSHNIDIEINRDFTNYVKINSSNHDNTEFKELIESTIKRALQYYYEEKGIELFANMNKLNVDYFYSSEYRDYENNKVGKIKKDSIVNKTLYVYFDPINSKNKGFNIRGNGYNDIIINMI